MKKAALTRRLSCLLSAVMTFTGNNFQNTIGNTIDNTVCIVYPAAPQAAEIALKRFRFPNSRKRFSLDVFYQSVYSF